MTFRFRIRPFFLVVLIFVSAMVARAAPVRAYAVGEKVKLVLTDDTHVEGIVSAVGSDSIDVRQKRGAVPVTVPLSQILRERHSLRSHFATGPCVDPISLVVFSPFLLIAHATGH